MISKLTKIIYVPARLSQVEREPGEEECSSQIGPDRDMQSP